MIDICLQERVQANLADVVDSACRRRFSMLHINACLDHRGYLFNKSQTDDIAPHVRCTAWSKPASHFISFIWRVVGMYTDECKDGAGASCNCSEWLRLVC